MIFNISFQFQEKLEEVRMPPKKGAKAAAKAAPKRKAPAKGKGRGGKKSKAEEPEESEEEEVAAATAKDFAAKLKAADKGKKRQAKPDSFCPLSGSATVSMSGLQGGWGMSS